jgi:hypothetical protein
MKVGEAPIGQAVLGCGQIFLGVGLAFNCHIAEAASAVAGVYADVIMTRSRSSPLL